ncbi:MAG: hypothetical protein GXC76_16590 [Rhodanobacteraceae bacterium]|nr:hypothetical protein [Rhodanobacteraceae bacterium]
MKRLLALLPLLAGAAFAHAEVKHAAADAFTVTFAAPLHAPPAKAWAGLVQVQHWWSGEHTWSGQAANLSLQANAGGCFCERWPAGSAEHGRVVMALPDRLLRLDAALGPLQEFALKGILSFWIKPGADAASSELEVEYRVNGAADSALDGFAPQVDAVLGAQVARLVRYVDTGSADEPPQPAAAAAATPADAQAAARAAILEEWKKSAEAAKPSPSAKPAPKKPATKPDGTD